MILSWGPGTWRRTSSGAYVWRKRSGPTLARIEHLESGLWKPWVFPYGESDDGRPMNVVDWRRPTRTLSEAKDVAYREFHAQRRVIEQG